MASAPKKTRFSAYDPDADGKAAQAVMLHKRACTVAQSAGMSSEEYAATHPVTYHTVAGNHRLLAKACAENPAAVNEIFQPAPYDGSDGYDLPSFKRFNREYSPLHFAVMFDDLKSVEILIAAGANPSLFSGGVTPTGIAAYASKVDILNFLAKKGADILLLLTAEQEPAHAGSTLLHRVMGREIPKKARIVRILAEHYDDPLILTAAGLSPLDCANPGDEGHRTLSEVVAERARAALDKSTKRTPSRKRTKPGSV